MRTTRKIIVLLLVLALFTTVLPAAFAAGSGAGSYEAGSKVSVKFAYENEKGIDGYLSFSNPSLFKEDVKNLTTILAGNGLGAYNKADMHWSFACGQADSISISFNLTIKDNAKAGDSCVITHKYRVNLPDNSGMTEERTESITITVKATPTPSKVDYTELKKQIGIAEGLKKSNYTSTSWAALESALKNAKAATTSTSQTTVDNAAKALKNAIAALVKVSTPTPTPNKVDYTELKNQINIAQGLDKTKYTSTSWAALETALKNAKAATSSKSQTTVDNAAKALKDAIAALVEMNYSALLDAIAKVDTLNKDNALADLFKQLYDAVAEGKALLSSGDQAAVDASTAKILDLLAKIAAKMEELGKTETVVVDKEVQVEVLPEDDYCNIHIHKVWPILFWISLALNIGFIVLIVVYCVKKKKNRTDTTPLVDYDIADDEV